MSDGKRKITNISEVVEIKNEDIVLNEIFTFDQTGITDNMEVNGAFTKHGRPKIYDKILSRGIEDIKNIF